MALARHGKRDAERFADGDPFSRPTAAYVHVPFCRRRCGYCNFTLVANRDDLIDSYLDALELELRRLEHPPDVDTLFLGGGTPSHLPLPQLKRLLHLIGEWFPLRPGGEYSIECNPNDVHPSLAQLLDEFGVNRYSLGVQSFDAAKLEALERDHRRADVLQAVEVAHRHAASVSIDLIFGAPDETLSIWLSDLEQTLKLHVHHVSTYGLTIEKGTTFFSRERRGILQTATDELEREMYESAIDRLEAAGYDHYETSNFARRDHRCRHNHIYWTGKSYYGVGPGAARYVDGTRSMNHRSTTRYIQKLLGGEDPTAEQESLNARQRAQEKLVFGLRMLEGIDVDLFAKDTGYTIEQLVGDRVKEMQRHGWLQQDEQQLRLTREGLMISDGLWPFLLEDRG